MRGRSLTRLLCAVLLVMGVGTATAQSDRSVELSLDEVLRLALANNLDLVSARVDPDIAEQQINVSKAGFDAQLSVNLNYTDASEDSDILESAGPTPLLSGGAVDFSQTDGSVTWEQLTKFGASYSVVLNASDSDSTNQEIQTVTGFLTASTRATTDERLTLNYTMPLLQGFGKEVATEQLVLAQNNRDISKENLRSQAISTIKSVVDAYWDLVATREGLEVAEESLKLARDLYELNKKKVEVGTMAPIDVTQAEAGVAEREEGVIIAQVNLENAEDELRRLLAIPRGDEMWLSRVVPTDSPSFDEVDVDLEAALEEALRERSELANAQTQLRSDQLSERVSRRNLRHGLDFNLQITPNRDDQDLLFQNISGGVAVTVSDSFTESDGSSWNAGLTYRYPIGNRTAKANYKIAQLTRQRSEVDVRSQEQTIRVDVRRAVRSVDSGVKRVAAARANSVLQRKTLEAEQKKFENGMSTSFQVLEIQRDLSNAQFSEIQAILDYNKALADLERAKGTLLRANGLSL